MANKESSSEPLKCSFCGKSQKQVIKLIAGPGVYICDECIELCIEIIEEEKGILPMYEIKNKDTDNYINIGTRGGATKISSGYAFSFFLRKLTQNINKYHSYWDEWMD